ncbi:predicted protein [Naegleria gruberi]|uniref:Predicted protein n=1 Tax=Naegleria gruberi TaxID=5762 RepID=D2VGE7_NAEGR|nr:uncharacterized protein NAEGRDRAFT_49328 [Naegleria gruberi]EFC44049.1 predicted protein [Naegleria gruberi]|eukprot:XP_002676793.1 predicted protein [Naegleria gruberi strain NEG-M]
MSATINNRLAVVPNRMTLQLMENRLNSAKRGQSMLRKKSDALRNKFYSIVNEIKEEKEGMTSLFRKSFFSLTEARYSAGDLSFAVTESVKSAAVRVTSHMENVSGVKFAVFTQVDNQEEKLQFKKSPSRKQLSFLSRGGEEIQNCKLTFSETLHKMIRLANLQTSFISLDQAIKSTNRRVNALEKIIQPKLSNTISYINEELEQTE